MKFLFIDIRKFQERFSIVLLKIYACMQGDVLYLTVDTHEGRRYHITCCTKGFYVNATTEAGFRPTPSPSHRVIHHSLLDLLSSISISFKRAIALILKKRSEKHIFERLPTPYQVSLFMK